MLVVAVAASPPSGPVVVAAISSIGLIDLILIRLRVVVITGGGPFDIIPKEFTTAIIWMLETRIIMAKTINKKMGGGRDVVRGDDPL